MSKSLYQTLHISENASADDIKKAYRKLARQYHPDVNKSPEAEEKFKEINGAYEILSDPQKKAEYDQYGDAMFNGQSFSDFSRSHQGADLNDILRSIFGARGGYNSAKFGGFGGFGGFNSRIHDDIDFDIQANVTISLKSAINGDTIRVNLNNSSFDLKIPEGITDGTKLRAKGKGNRFGNMTGDAIITVKIAPENGFEIDDYDLIQDVETPLKIMLFGGKCEITTLQKPMTIKIPENMQNGQKMRIEGLGFKNRKNGKRGALILRIKAKLPNPKTFSPELKELLQKEL